MNMWARNRKICRLDLFVEPEICVDHVIRYVGISVRCSENTFLFVHQQSRRKCVEYASIENKIHTHSMHLCIDISWCEPIEFHAIFFVVRLFVVACIWWYVKIAYYFWLPTRIEVYARWNCIFGWKVYYDGVVWFESVPTT